MKKIKLKFLTLLTILLPFSVWAQDVSFEGILTTRVSFGGIDLSNLVEKIDNQNGDANQQIQNFFTNLSAKDQAKFQTLAQRNPLMPMMLMMTPPKGTIYLKNGVALAKTKGLSYNIEHYHNPQTDEAFLYTASLLNQGDEVTAAYKPSEGYDALFSDDKRITTEFYNLAKLSETAQVAGYPCSITSYTLKSQQKKQQAANGLPVAEVRKLLVYTSKDMTKSINFSHPYYLPEENGIMRIDIFMDETNEPTMIYEIVKVEKKTIDANLLQPKMSTPLYKLTDTTYGLKLFAIIMEGMAALNGEDDDEIYDDDDYDDEDE